MEKINLFEKKWTEKPLYPYNYSRWDRFHNGMAKVWLGPRGAIQREFLPDARYSEPYYFNVESLKDLDIVRVTLWDDRKKRKYQKYYLVLEKGEDNITFEELQTYRLALKARIALEETVIKN